MINSGNVQKLFRNAVFPVMATVEEWYPEEEVILRYWCIPACTPETNTCNKAKDELAFLTFRFFMFAHSHIWQLLLNLNNIQP